MVMTLPAIQETRVQSLGWEDSQEKEMAIHFGILAWKITWTEKPGGHSPWGSKEPDMTEQLKSKCFIYINLINSHNKLIM